MSIAIMTKVWGTELGGPTIKAVAMKMADCAHDNGRNAWPSVKHIARHTETSDRAVRYAIKHLRVKLKVLRLERAGGGAKTSVYAFDLARLDELNAATKMKWEKEDAETPAKFAGVQDVQPPPAPRAPKPSVNQKAGLAPQVGVQEQLDGDGLIPFGSTDGTAHYIKGSPSFLAVCHKLCVDPIPILKRFAEKTKGQKIRRPTAYLVRMAQEEAAERNGLTAADIAAVSVASREGRAEAMAAQVGVTPEPAYVEDEFRKRLAAPRSNGSALVAALEGRPR
jgi:hypothetical protein